MKIVLAFSYVVLSFTISVSAETKSLRFGIIPMPPLSILKDKKLAYPKPGVVIELLSLLEKRLELQIKYKLYPAKRLQIKMEDGELDGALLASYSKNREEWISYPKKNGQIDVSRKMLNLTYVLYKWRDSPLQWDGKKITNITRRIGAGRGSSIVKFLKKLQIRVDKVNSDSANMEKLLLHRIDGVATFDFIGDALLENNPERYKNIVKVFPPLISKLYYLPLSFPFVEKNPELAEKIWDTVAELGKSVEFKKIQASYAE